MAVLSRGKTAVPLSFEQFGNRFWRSPQTHHFVNAMGVIPLASQEIGAMVTEFPIYFGQHQADWTVFTDLGSSVSESILDADRLLVTKGRPFLVNTYPFTAISVEGSWALGVFDDPEYVSDTGRAFFDDGKPSQTVRQVTKRMAQFLEGRKLVGSLAKALAEAGVLRCDKPRDASGWSIWQVDESKLAGIEQVQLCALHKNGGLALAYAQVISQVHTRTSVKPKTRPATAKLPQMSDGFLDAIMNDIDDPDADGMGTLIQ